MPLAADSPTDRVQQLIILTDRLSSLIVQETELLKTNRPSEIQDFRDERAKLSNIYVQEMQLISNNKSLIDGVDKELKLALKEQTSRFREKLDAHGKVLFRVRTVTENMLQSIADEVARKKRMQNGYSHKAEMNGGAAHNPATLSLDETI